MPLTDLRVIGVAALAGVGGTAFLASTFGVSGVSLAIRHGKALSSRARKRSRPRGCPSSATGSPSIAGASVRTIERYASVLTRVLPAASEDRTTFTALQVRHLVLSQVRGRRSPMRDAS